MGPMGPGSDPNYGGPMPMGVSGAAGLSSEGVASALPQLLGAPQEIAAAAIYKSAGLDDGFDGALIGQLNDILIDFGVERYDPEQMYWNEMDPEPEFGGETYQYSDDFDIGG